MDEVAKSTYQVLTTCTRRDLPLTEKEFVILIEQCLLCRAYELMLVFFPAQNPVIQLYLPSMLSVPGPIADLLISLGDDVGVVNGFDMPITAEAKPSTDVPEYRKPHTELWVKYQELRNLTCARF